MRASDLVPAARSAGGHSAHPLLVVERWSGEGGGSFGSGSHKALEHLIERGQCAGSCRTVGKLGEMHPAADLDNGWCLQLAA